MRYGGGGSGLVSSFTNADGLPIPITSDQGVFTVCSRADVWHGGHASCYMEFIVGKDAYMQFYDLVTPGHGRVQLREMDVQHVHSRKGVKLNEEDQFLRHLATMKHHSYAITFDQVQRVEDAFRRFDAKVANGRYAYSLPGGMLGRVVGTFSGQRGVNCADLILKLLSEAGITNVGDKLINTPRYAAGSSKR